MGINCLIRRLARVEVVVLACAALIGGACATGVEPDRSALEGAGGASSSANSSGALVGSSNSSASSGPGASSSAASTSAASTSGAGGAGGGAGGAGGAGGSIIEDAGADGPPPTGLRVQYKLGDNNPSNDQIKAIFNIINDSQASVALSELSIRYWYTLEGGDQAQQFFCDYAMVGAANVHGAFAQKVGVMADHYVAVTFTAGDMIPPSGGQSGELQARWNKSSFTMMDESNDYSYDGTKVNFADWTKVTLYHNGTLVWGVEP